MRTKDHNQTRLGLRPWAFSYEKRADHINVSVLSKLFKKFVEIIFIVLLGLIIGKNFFNKLLNSLIELWIKLNSASVVPVIFANAITSLITTVSYFGPRDIYTKVQSILAMDSVSGLVIYAVLILIFTFMYVNMQMDAAKMADELAKSGAYINGLRPGKETEKYLYAVINRLTVAGGLSLVLLAVLPHILLMVSDLPTAGAIGGTGMVIVVGVALETLSTIKAMQTPRRLNSLS